MRNDSVLMHYGVRGMKWRNRKSSTGALEGVQNNPASVNKSKIRKNSSYTNVRLNRLAQLRARNDEIKKGLDGGAIKGSVAKKSAERVNTVSKGALKGMYNPKPKVSKEYEEEKNYNSKKNKYPEGMDPNQKSKIRKKKTR